MRMPSLLQPKWVVTGAAICTVFLTRGSLHRLALLVAEQQQRETKLQPLSTGVPDHPSAVQLQLDSLPRVLQAGSKAGSNPDGGGQAVSLQQRLQPLPANSTAMQPYREGPCEVLPHTDYWGDAIVWGPNNKKASAAACCQQCMETQPEDLEQQECNVWVWCGDQQACGAQYQDCWIKHLAHPGGSVPKKGPTVPWTAGLYQPARQRQETPPQEPGEDRSYHVVITAQGTATHWQARVAHYWYLKVRQRCRQEGACDMGGFTRILHSGQPDDLMQEVPTFVADPIPSEDGNRGYVVLNRPYAVLQWVQQAAIPERYVLMSEPDHLWLKPMPNLMRGDSPAAFPFFYIEPSKQEYRHLTERFTGPLTRRQAEAIPPIGNAPTLLSMEQLRAVTPVWLNTSKAIFHDEESREAWGWVQEMYGFAISCWIARLPRADLHIGMMAQPPWDTEMGSYYLLHYTYGMDYSLAGEFLPGEFGPWRFDKRTYASLPPPRALGMPPEGIQNSLVRHLIGAINEATEAIPGWDSYATSGRATQVWRGGAAAEAGT